MRRDNRVRVSNARSVVGQGVRSQEVGGEEGTFEAQDKGGARVHTHNGLGRGAFRAKGAWSNSVWESTRTI